MQLAEDTERICICMWEEWVRMTLYLLPIMCVSHLFDIFSLILHFIVFLIILIFWTTSVWKHITEDADTFYLCKMLKLHFWSYLPSILFLLQS